MKKAIYVVFCLVSISMALKKCSDGETCKEMKSCGWFQSKIEKSGRINKVLKQELNKMYCGFTSRHKTKICCPINNKLRIEERYLFDAASLLPDRKICGIMHSDRIYGGIMTNLEDHPWMAMIRYNKPNGNWGFYCGGVLISSRYVLTAAHCAKSLELPVNWTISQVRLGEWNVSSLIDCTADGCNEEPVDVDVEEIITHELFNASDSNQHHDIALLRLARTVYFTDFIKPICLPTTKEQRQKTYEDYDLEVAGWGTTERQFVSEVKLKVQVPVFDMVKCKLLYKRKGRHVSGRRQLCAGGVVGKDSCRGDSGGALMGMSDDAKNWLAVGIVSYGPNPCGASGYPGMYTRVGAYIDWIMSNLRP